MIIFHSFLLLKYISFHSIYFHSFIIFPLHYIPNEALRDQPFPKKKKKKKKASTGSIFYML